MSPHRVDAGRQLLPPHSIGAPPRHLAQRAAYVAKSGSGCFREIARAACERLHWGSGRIRVAPCRVQVAGEPQRGLSTAAPANFAASRQAPGMLGLANLLGIVSFAAHEAEARR